MNKKGDELKFLYLVIWAVFLGVVLFIISLFTSAFVREQIDIRDAEARILANRLLYSPTGISWEDKDLGRNYPGTVDLEKVNGDFIDRSLRMEGNQMIAANIEVKNNTGGLLGSAPYNIDWYERWLPLAGETGSGASTWIQEKRYVVVYRGRELIGPGVIEISMLVPNG